LARFAELPAHVLGLSVDSVYAHAAFAEQLGGLDFPLLADFHPKGEVAQAYGLWRPDRGYSRRAIVVVDPAGIVRHSHVIERGLPDIDQVLATAASLASHASPQA
jgi:alkyl hydroperoxide reductase subunit AhpC